MHHPVAHKPRFPKEQSIRTVFDALRRIVRELRLGARGAERDAGLSGAQLFVLQSLADESASSLNALAERTMTDQSSVSVVVARLAEKKLVVRTPSEEDRRRIELRVTAAGRRMLARCPEPTQARLLSALRHLTPAKLAALAEGMEALVHEMGIAGDAPQMFFEESPPKPVRNRPRGPADDDAR
jgi:DNA-binding MarR family transcriptional regulator